ncbi:amidohydrolase family protein [Ekhidna sp.]
MKFNLKNLKTLIVILTIIFSGCSTAEQTQSSITVLKGATSHDGNGNTIEQSVILIQDGKIKSIGDQSLEIPSGAEIIDVTGKYITPGLVDSHMHFAQTGFFDGRPDVVDLRDSLDFDLLQADLRSNPDSYYEAYLRSGVTAVYDVGGFPWSIERQAEAESNLSAPHVAAAGPLFSALSETRLSPFNTENDKQMLNLSDSEFGRETVRKHTKMGSTGVKIWGIQVGDSSFMNALNAVADETKLQGNKLIVHATTLDQAKEALRLGAKVLVHSVQDVEVDDEFIKLAQENDVIYSPTITVVRGYLNTFRSLKKIREVSDSNDVMDDRAKALLQSSTEFYSFYPAQVDLEEQMFGFEQRINAMEEVMAINLKKVHEAGITIAVATDAGNPGTFHGLSIYDEMIAMQEAGIPPNEIITMATKNGALAMDRIEDFGTLEEGKLADLIILKEDPSTDISNMRSITHVMRGGLLRPVNEPFNK